MAVVGNVGSTLDNPGLLTNIGSTSLALTTNGSISAESIFNESYLDRQAGYNQKRMSYAEAELGRNKVIDTKIKNIIHYIENGSEKKAMKAYSELLDEMSKQKRYAQLVDGEGNAQLRAVARQLIENSDACAGRNFEDLITENMDTSFERGFKINFESDSYTQEDILKEMCDIDETNMLTKPKRIAGNLGRAALCAAAGFLIFSNPVGAAAGLFIGGAIGLVDLL